MQEKNISKNNLECCQKCAICTQVCPVMANNPKYAGPKQSGPDGERYRLKNGIFFDDALKYCMNCKRCEVACPSGVRVADMIQQAKIEYGHIKPKVRDLMLANTDFMGPIASTFAPIVNWGLGLQLAKDVLGMTIGIAPHRTMPKYASETFEKWFRKNAEAAQKDFPKQIAYFHGCYANYNYPQLGKDFVAVMNALGYGVNIMKEERCCGVAKMTNGMSEAAKRDAAHNLKLFRKEIAKGREIVTVSTSCTMMMRDEYSHVLGVANDDVREHISLVEKFIYEAVSNDDVKLVWKKDYKARTCYHAPCHQERMGWAIFTTELLRMIPGLEFEELRSNCCGIAGTYGFKKENYAVSQAIGKPLFDQIKEIAPDFVACECETCKWQIEMSTGFPVKNPVSILAEALDLEATAAANKKA